MTFNDQTDQIIISATIVQGLTAVRTLKLYYTKFGFLRDSTLVNYIQRIL